MKKCPQCHNEFDNRKRKCSDCHVPLIQCEEEGKKEVDKEFAEKMEGLKYMAKCTAAIWNKSEKPYRLDEESQRKFDLYALKLMDDYAANSWIDALYNIASSTRNQDEVELVMTSYKKLCNEMTKRRICGVAAVLGGIFCLNASMKFANIVGWLLIVLGAYIVFISVPRLMKHAKNILLIIEQNVRKD